MVHIAYMLKNRSLALNSRQNRFTVASLYERYGAWLRDCCLSHQRTATAEIHFELLWNALTGRVFRLSHHFTWHHARWTVGQFQHHALAHLKIINLH